MSDHHSADHPDAVAKAAIPGDPMAGDLFETIDDQSPATSLFQRDQAFRVVRAAPCADATEMVGRYQLGACIGGDAGGRLYIGRDNAIGRNVAFKTLLAARASDIQRRARFFNEMALSAELDHPNIPPIYDLDQNEAGDLYYTTRDLGQMTLAKALALARAGERPACIATWRQMAAIIGKVADALAYAHGRGILHRDIKPDHILIGEHGEVFLTGWQIARRVVVMQQQGPPARPVGTPVYMAPEVARGQSCDRAADVYALGATLWQTLMLSPPCWDADSEAFWARKRAGAIDAPDPAALAAAPAHLMTVARRALAMDTLKRQSDAREFADELALAIERQAVVEIGQGAAGMVRQPVRGLRISLAAAAILALAAIAGAAWMHKAELHDRMSLPPLVINEDFRGPQLNQHLRVLKGWTSEAAGLSDFRLEPGRLVSTGPWLNYLFCDRMLTGKVVVEFTGEILRGHLPGDLSLAWVPQDPFRSGANPLNGVTLLQVGGWDNEYSQIFLKYYGLASTTSRASLSDFKLEVGRRYRMRFELDGSLYRILVDGAVVCEYRDDSVPARAGWVGIYAANTGKAFSDLRIFAEQDPQVPITAIPETFLREGLNDLAAQEFARIAREMEGKPMAVEAGFRQGLALSRSGRQEEARRIWKSISQRPWCDLAAIQLIDLDFAAGNHAAVLATIASLYRTAPELRPRLNLAWSKYVYTMVVPQAGKISYTTVPAPQKPGKVEDYLALERDLLEPTIVVQRTTADALLLQGRPQEVLDRFGHLRSVAATALLALGREQEVLERFPDRIDQVQRALTNLGRFAEFRQRFEHGRNLRELGLVLEGKADEALLLTPYRGDSYKDLALLALGRSAELESILRPEIMSLRVPFQGLHAVAQGDPEEAVRLLTVGHPHTQRNILACALLRLDRVTDADSQVHPDLMPVGKRLVAQYRALLAHLVGDTAAEAQLRQELAARPVPGDVEQGAWIYELVLQPVIDQLGGASTAVADARKRLSGVQEQRWAGLPWLALALIAGDPAASAPERRLVPLVIPGMEAICSAIRLDIAGQHDAAVAAYRAYLALPYARRLWGSINGSPVLDRFARWRSEGL